MAPDLSPSVAGSVGARPDPTVRRAKRVAALIAVPVALIAGLGVFALLGGFGAGKPSAGPASGPASAQPQATSPVTVAAPVLGDRAATVCRALLSQVPAQLRDRVRRPVTAASGGTGSEQNAAYGDPPIILACGVTTPSYAPEENAVVLSGVCWLTRKGAGGSAVFTTLDREVPIAVTVPASYTQPGQWVIEFSPAIVGSVPSIAKLPFGCTG
jgi:hypothetical protein